MTAGRDYPPDMGSYSMLPEGYHINTKTGLLKLSKKWSRKEQLLLAICILLGMMTGVGIVSVLQLSELTKIVHNIYFQVM